MRGPIRAESKAVVELSAYLLDAFGSAQVTNASACELRRPASAGGVKQDALFEHPAVVGRPARVSYSLNLPAVEKGQLLLFAFDIGIAIGRKSPCGVRCFKLCPRLKAADQPGKCTLPKRAEAAAKVIAPRHRLNLQGRPGIPTTSSGAEDSK